MEDIDIETLNFEKYNREVYQENQNKSTKEESPLINAQKNYKMMIDKFVANYYKKLNDKNESGGENLDRMKKRKY